MGHTQLHLRQAVKSACFFKGANIAFKIKWEDFKFKFKYLKFKRSLMGRHETLEKNVTVDGQRGSERPRMRQFVGLKYGDVCEIEGNE